MNGTRKGLASLALAAVLATLAGCPSGKPGPAKPADSRSAGQYFKETQSCTVTPHGAIVTGTVEEKGDRIEYETWDGKRWSVGYSKRADGTYDYQAPRPAE